jgi:hypothetical protein
VSKAVHPIDIDTTADHHDFVSFPARGLLSLTAATLLAWHGVLLAMPHNHADAAVPQEELVCSASHPLSQTNHLHASGRLLTPHPCLACLASTTTADTLDVSGIDGPMIGQWIGGSASTTLPVGPDFSLPPLRGPPPRT